jgi:RNA polymerase sigma-70 factor (ECF subfamily)
VAYDVRAEIVSLLPRLRRFARSLTREPTDADDLVQAAVVRALERLDQWQAGTRLDSWLFRIVQTVWLDELRRRRVRAAAPEPVEELMAEDGARTVDRRLLLERTRRAMQRLPDDQRILLGLIVVEGLSYREAADVVGVPVGTVMSRLARARRRLWSMVMDDRASSEVA